MDKIVVNNIADSKPSFLVSVQAAAAITLGVAQLALFVGTNVKDVNNQRTISALEGLRDRFKEADFPVGAAAINLAAGTPPNAAAYVVSNPAALGAGHTEDEILIAYGATFYDAGNSTNFLNAINRAIEVYQEQVLKFN